MVSQVDSPTWLAGRFLSVGTGAGMSTESFGAPNMNAPSTMLGEGSTIAIRNSILASLEEVECPQC